MKSSQLQDKMVNSDRVLYTPSAFAKNNLMYLQEIGHLQALSTHTSKRSRLSSFLFFYVQSGSVFAEPDLLPYNSGCSDSALRRFQR